MRGLSAAVTSAVAIALTTASLSTAMAGPYSLPGASVTDGKGYFLGVVDSCPEGSFGCVIRRQAPNGKWVRLGASGRELFSLYDVSLSGLYYSGSGCGGDLFFTPLNTLVPEVAIINRTNSGSTYTGDLIYPKSYNAAFSYASYRKGPVCVTASGTASGFLASTTKITFTGPLSFR